MHILASTASAVVLSLALAAQAGATSTAMNADGAAAITGAESAAAEAAGLVDIVVTATKRETNLQKTPIAISVVNDTTLADRHVQSLLDFADGAVPGLRVATFEARQSALTIGIRGIVPLDANQPARDQGVGVYIDGVYLGRQHGLNAALMDIERIEVLKGPQGTLFGRNTEGGALSMISKLPTGQFGLRMNAGVGNYGAYSGAVHLDLPEFANFSVKLDGAVQYRKPTVRNPLPGATGWNYYDRRGGRVSVRWKPSTNFTADYAYDNSYDANSPFYSQLLNYNVQGRPIGNGSNGTIAPLPPIVQVGEDRMTVADIGVPQQPSVDKSFGHMLRLSWSVSPDLELRSITAYRELSVEQWDNAGGAHRVPAFAPNGNFSRYSLAGLWQHQVSQEFQAVGSLGRIDYVGGLYYFRERAEDDASTPSTNRWNADGTGYTINDPTPTIRGHRSIDRASVAYTTSYAVYGQATWTPPLWNDIVHLTVGGRYTHDAKRGRLFIVNNVATDFRFKTKNDRFDPMVTLAVDAARDVNLYAKFATGYRSGGASSRSLTYRSFGPEEVKSYEIGAKTELFDRHLRFNVAGYIMDRTGSQIDFSLVTPQANGSTRNTLETINAPRTTRIRGVEVEATARLTDALTIGGSYAYTYTKIPPTVNPFNGVLQPVYIVFTPRNAASGSVDYQVPVGNLTARLHLDANYAQATQTFDQFAIKADASFVVNGRLSLADIPLGVGNTRMTVSVWSRNLFDTEYVYRRDPSNRATLGDYGNFNEPRTFGIEASLRI
ncbi:TonB-dependent receptor [Flavisphingomonas formosensis]|uniref:TonB-dependent receptor n=1 Tax=Flavisphingomonas formosensis TaxID=861534 RepID=UPI0012FBA618|nr:TonB-dependent receptor [Sphingomonas formosensis]